MLLFHGALFGEGCVWSPPVYRDLSPLYLNGNRKNLVGEFRKNITGNGNQRCKVHLMRNILGRVSHKDKKAFAEKLKQIWVQPDRLSAVRTARIFMAEYLQKHPKAIAALAEGLEDSLRFYAFAEVDARKISSTNVLERLNKEICRRSRVVGVFPSEEYYVRLLCCYLIEHTEDWEHEKNYIRKDGRSHETSVSSFPPGPLPKGGLKGTLVVMRCSQATIQHRRACYLFGTKVAGGLPNLSPWSLRATTDP